MFLDIDSIPWHRVFRDVACDILLESGLAYTVHDGYTVRKMDRIMCDESGNTILVHFHHYDFREVGAKLVHNSSHQLYTVMRTHGIKSGILVFSARRPIAIAANWLGDDGSKIEHLGALELQAMVMNKPLLKEKFDDYLHRRGFELVGQMLVPTSKDTFNPAVAFSRGSELASRLKHSKAGKGDAGLFETLCSEAINLLFGDQIERYNTQFNVDDDLSRIDYLATLNTRNWNGFWRDLGTYFNCRYVVFEFKNYTKKIGQDAITSTAKYLNPKALRSVAILVARNGETANAKKKREQLLRSEGSLIIVIDHNELIRMLLDYDQGYDPSEALSVKLHVTLTTLSK